MVCYILKRRCLDTLRLLTHCAPRFTGIEQPSQQHKRLPPCSQGTELRGAHRTFRQEQLSAQSGVGKQSTHPPTHSPEEMDGRKSPGGWLRTAPDDLPKGTERKTATDFRWIFQLPLHSTKAPSEQCGSQGSQPLPTFYFKHAARTQRVLSAARNRSANYTKVKLNRKSASSVSLLRPRALTSTG